MADVSAIDHEFQEWKIKHDKVYPTPEEEARRKVLWLTCRERVLAHNAEADQGKHTWWMGLNQFSDRDSDEPPCCCMKPQNLNKECCKSDGETKDGC